MKKNSPEIQVSVQQLSLLPEKISRSTIIRWMQHAAEKDGVFAVRFVDEKVGLELNKTYRGKNQATNILTFDYTKEPIVEADLIVCVPVLQREAREQHKSLKEHLAHLLIHGVLHAQGYDHMTDKQAEIMEKKEVEILRGLGFSNPYS